MNWLPNRNTQRTNNKTISELISFYFQYLNHFKVFCKGQKPDFIPVNKILAKRDRQSYRRKENWKKPITEAQAYSDYLNSHPDFSGQNAAEKFNVSRARISQMISLLTKLPDEIINCLKNENGLENSFLCTERKLRPLTIMKTDEEKWRRLNG